MEGHPKLIGPPCSCFMQATYPPASIRRGIARSSSTGPGTILRCTLDNTTTGRQHILIITLVVSGVAEAHQEVMKSVGV
jgi:hypothetical protein